MYSGPAGGWALAQNYVAPAQDYSGTWESSEDAVIVARSHAALAPFIQTGKWRTADPFKARPWTDDYTNLAGSMYSNLKAHHPWLP